MKFNMLHSLTPQELYQKLYDLKKESFNIRFASVLNPEINKNHLRFIKRDVARIKTRLTQLKTKE